MKRALVAVTTIELNSQRTVEQVRSCGHANFYIFT